MKIFGLIVFIIAIAVALSFLMAWPFMWIWNYAIVSAVSVTNPIGYWVAFWLMLFMSFFIAGLKSSSSSKS